MEMHVTRRIKCNTNDVLTSERKTADPDAGILTAYSQRYDPYCRRSARCHKTAIGVPPVRRWQPAVFSLSTESN